VSTPLPLGLVHHSPHPRRPHFGNALLSGPLVRDQVLPLSRGPSLRFPHDWRFALRPAASLSVFAPPVSPRLPLRHLPYIPTVWPNFFPGRTPPLRASPLTASTLASPLSSPTPRASAFLPGPFLLPRNPLHPDPVLPPFPASSSPSNPLAPLPPNSLGLAARPLSQQSCSLSSSACGRLTSQSQLQVTLGAPPQGLVGSVVLESCRPRAGPVWGTTTYPRDFRGCS
jgi:hypothetical protein